MEKKNNYPVILVHGFSGFGDSELISKVFPYFGMWNANINKFYKRLGTECYTPSIGPFSSCWDRACELYAHLVGGTVDYGKVHSENSGHKRYGRTYQALVPNWGELDDDGKMQKINLIGHSLGGPTVRLFVELCVNGSQEEIDGTDSNEVSDFFKGGKEKWIHSVTTLASANEGVSSLYAVEKLVPFGTKVMLQACSLLGNTPFGMVYDFGLDQYGITQEPGLNFDFTIKNDEIKKCMSSEDCVMNDLMAHKAKERMKDFKTFDSIYYFAYAGCRTQKSKKSERHVPKKKMFLPFQPVALILGAYKSDKHDANHLPVTEEYFPSDGMVNTISAVAPENEKHENFVSNSNCVPGVWYNMPIEEKDHMSYMGIGEKSDVYWNFFYDILYRICNLESVN